MSHPAREHDESGDGLATQADLITPMAIRVAATLRLADHLADGTATAVDLAVEVGAEPTALERLLRHLAAVGIMIAEGDGFRLTERGAALQDAHPSGLRRVLDIERSLGRADLVAFRMLETIRSGEPGYAALHGRGFWEDMAADAARQADYDERMGSDVRGWAAAIVPALDWSAFERIVDVGGGDGSLLAAILGVARSSSGTVLEQAAATAAARRRFEAAGLADRADAVEGSFFEPLPRGAGAYLLCAILHDWGDAAAIAILRRCAEAAAPAGRVIVIERSGVGGEAPSTRMDLRMLLYFGGRERGVGELSDLARTAGLSVAAIHAAGVLSLLELAPLAESSAQA